MAKIKFEKSQELLHILKYNNYVYLASNSGTLVKHMPKYPKVWGSIQAAIMHTEKENMAKK